MRTGRRNFLKGMAAAPAVAVPTIGVDTAHGTDHSIVRLVGPDGELLVDYKNKRMVVTGTPSLTALWPGLQQATDDIGGSSDQLDIRSDLPIERIGRWHKHTLTGDLTGWPPVRTGPGWTIDKPFDIRNAIFMGYVGFNFLNVDPERDHLYMNGTAIGPAWAKWVELDEGNSAMMILANDDYRFLLLDVDQAEGRIRFAAASASRLTKFETIKPHDGQIAAIPL